MLGNYNYDKSFLSFAPAMENTSVKDRIREMARQLVVRYGVRSVSMDDFANHMGMSKKTLYQYFKDKNELVDEVVTGILEESRSLCTTLRSDARDAIEEVFFGMDVINEVMKTMNPLLIYDLQKYHPNCFQKFLAHKHEFLENMVRENIIRGKKEGNYRDDLDAEMMARFRVDSMMILMNPSFERFLEKGLGKVHQDILLHFVYGLATPQGFKLIQKYHKQWLGKKTA